MASRGPSYGLSREVKMRLKSKYSEEIEQGLREWISESTGLKLPPDLSFCECLKDGIVLCALMDYLEPGHLSKKLPHTKMLNAFRCMENIAAFLKAAEEFGVAPHSLFQTVDLYDESNMYQVQTCLLALVDKAKSKGLTTSDLGIYVAEKQNREWSNEQLRAGEGIIGLQAGTNKCASQSGMTPYGAPRPAYQKKYTGLGEGADPPSSRHVSNKTYARHEDGDASRYAHEQTYAGQEEEFASDDSQSYGRREYSGQEEEEDGVDYQYGYQENYAGNGNEVNGD